MTSHENQLAVQMSWIIINVIMSEHFNVAKK